MQPARKSLAHLSSFPGSCLKSVLDFTFPPVCCHCGLPCSCQIQLCEECRADIEPVDSAELALEMSDLLENKTIDSVFALWMFDKTGPLASVHRLLKYGNRPRIGLALGHLLAETVQPGIQPDDLIIPVPLHRVRFLERGYNQSERLASGLCHALGMCPTLNTVSRVKSTQTQTGLNREQRIDNLDSAFSINPDTNLRGKRCIIVDDVLTTGATAASLARTLKMNGSDYTAVVAIGFTRAF